MAYPTFKPLSHPQSGMDRTKQPRTRSQKFLDGYEATQRLGRYNNLETISPAWKNANKAEADYIINFLDARAGDPFYYRPNDQGRLRCYKCTEYSHPQKSGNYYDISAKFQEMAMA